MSSRLVPPLLFLLLLPFGGGRPRASAQEPTAVGPSNTLELPVEVLGPSGNPVETLDGLAVQVLEGGKPVAAQLLLPPAHPWEVVVYIDRSLTPPAAVQRLARLLDQHLDELVALGPVELVVADPEPDSFLFATDRTDFLDEALTRLELGAVDADAISAIRASFLDKRRNRPDDLLALAREAFLGEVTTIRTQHDDFVAWLAERGRSSSPRLLVFLADALGRDPLSYYLDQTSAAAELASLGSDLPQATELAETVAAFGWTTVVDALPPEGPEKRLQYRPTEELPVGFRLGIGGRDRKRDEASFPEPPDLGLSLTSVDSLRPLADATAGAVLAAPEELAPLLQGIARRPRLRYRSTGEPGIRSLDVRSPGSDVRIRAPRLVSTVDPEAVAEVRLRHALAGETDEGEIVVASSLLFDPAQVGRHPARLTTDADLSAEALPGGGPVPVRLSVAVHVEDGETVFLHEVVSKDVDLENQQWRHETTIVLPSGTDAAAVTVANLLTGSWGLAWVDFADRRLSRATAPARRYVQILPPQRVDLRRGRVTLQVVAEPEVRRIEYRLNDTELASRSRPPFAVKVDLDPGRPSNEIVAIAFDREDRELDRDRLVLTETADSFWVRIVEPAPGPLAGPVDVEAKVKIPTGRILDRVDLYYTDRKLLSWTAPPYRDRIRVPVDSTGAYLRAAAVLDDGTMAEDVVLLNRPGFGEEIGVELVELYVVATDRNGQPVQGLRRGDFSVLEDDRPQQIETFSVGADLPLNLGLAIDSSSSLFARLPDVQRAAKGFVRGLIAERDRAFLVGFGMSPTVIRPITADLSRLVSGINSLKPFGTTPVWEAIALSLGELQAIDGRRALVVFYDGDDEDEDFSYRKCLALARQARIPIYLIVMNNAAARTEGRSLSTRDFASRLDRIALAGGGRVYFVPTTEDLRPIFDAISQELRSHYLLTYYPEPGGGPRWRPVQVKIDKRGLEAHTISGYGPAGVEWGN